MGGMNALGRRAASVGKLAAAAVLFVLAGGAFLGGCVFSAPRYRGPVTDHFDGKEFHSPWAKKMDVGFAQFLEWQRTRDPGPWHSHEGQPPGPPPPHRVGRGSSASPT